MGVPKLTPTELGIRHGRQLIEKLTRAELERIARRKPLNAYEKAKIAVIKEFLGGMSKHKPVAIREVKHRAKTDKLKERIRTLYIHYLTEEVKGRKVRHKHHVKQVHISGTVVEVRKGTFTNRYGRKVYGLKIIYESAKTGRELSKIVELPADTKYVSIHKRKREIVLKEERERTGTKSKSKKKSGEVLKPAKRQIGKSKSIERDKKLKALPPGKRRSRSGKIYYEYRQNRSDLRSGV
mgnify:CR=1 FL=1